MNNKIIRNRSKDITIVIITYNRYPFLIRLLQYYEKFKYGFHYLILDSSHDVMNDEMKSYLKMKNVTYRKYDPSIFFTAKIISTSTFCLALIAAKRGKSTSSSPKLWVIITRMFFFFPGTELNT